MIASHDTYTYMKARCGALNMAPGLWRCQEKTLEEQYEAGVRYLDVRVCRRGVRWRACHGLAEFGAEWDSLPALAGDVLGRFPEAMMRIVLEKNAREDRMQFEAEGRRAFDEHEGVQWLVIKKPWETLLWRGGYEIVDRTFKEWNMRNILKGNPIRRFAQRQERDMAAMAADRKRIYFLDMIG